MDHKLLDAARKCQGEILKDLVTRGRANVNARDQEEMTPLHLCSRSADLASLELLLEHGADPNLLDKKGNSPLHYAVDRDYIDTMVALVSHGADVSLRNKNTQMTPLQVALNKKLSMAIDILLFCGADTEDIPKGLLAGRNVQDQSSIVDGFKTEMIRVEGKRIQPNEIWTFPLIGVEVNNTQRGSSSFSLLCRRVCLDYIHGTYQGEIISDVFQYMVDKPVKGVYISVPAYTRATHYDVAFLADNSGNEYQCISTVHDKVTYFSSYVDLTPGDGDRELRTFGVILKHRVDRFTFTIGPTVVQSTTERNFKLQIPQACLQTNTVVELQVIPARRQFSDEEVPDILKITDFFNIRITTPPINTQLPSALSPFPQTPSPSYHVTSPVPLEMTSSAGHDTVDGCTVSPSSTQSFKLPEASKPEAQQTSNLTSPPSTPTERSDVMTTQLPCPPGSRDSASSQLSVYHARSRPEQETSWATIDPRIDRTGDTVCFQQPQREGTFVVVEHKKKQDTSIKQKIKRFLASLFTAGKYRLKLCEFFAMTKCLNQHENIPSYAILVEITTEFNTATRIKQREREGFEFVPLQKSSPFKADPNQKFLIKLLGDTIRVTGPVDYKVTFQEYRVNYRHFLVKATKNDIAQVLLYDLNSDNSLDETSHRCFASLVLQLSSVVDTNKPLQTYEDFPSSKMLVELASDIGQEWFMLGVALGNRCSYLERLENDNPDKKILLVLYSWRHENEHKEDSGLTVLLQSLERVGRSDLKTKLSQQILKWMDSHSDDKISRWAKVHLTKGSTTIKVSSKPVDSPFSEQFLLDLISIIGPRFELVLSLHHGLSEQQREYLVRQCPADKAMFKMLLAVQRNYAANPADFYLELFSALALIKQLEAEDQIKRRIRSWLTSEDGRTHPCRKQLVQLVRETPG